jgi:anthranilate phosphoribosyltransferase
LIQAALGNEHNDLAHKASDIIALNAGAAIYVSGIADTLEEGVARAQDALGSGLAGEKVRELAAFTECFK